jgi:hypothetical protein
MDEAAFLSSLEDLTNKTAIVTGWFTPLLPSSAKSTPFLEFNN